MQALVWQHVAMCGKEQFYLLQLEDLAMCEVHIYQTEKEDILLRNCSKAPGDNFLAKDLIASSLV